MKIMEKLEALQNDAVFMEAVEAADTMEQLQEVFARYGMELAQEEIRELLVAEETDCELTDEELDCVAGGGFFKWLGKKFKKTWKKESKKYTKFLNDL